MKHSHYHKILPCLNVDVYRVLHAFEVNDPCIQHSVKKLLVAGGRGAKDAKKDVEEAIDSLVRWLEMRREEEAQPEPPSLQSGDQIAWSSGDGWQYVTLKDSDLPNMQGNDLKVSICDTMNLADSFLKDIRATELAYAENQHKTLWTEADEERMRVVVHNGNDGEVYKQSMDWKRMGEEMKETLKPYSDIGRMTREMMQEQDKAGKWDLPNIDDGWLAHRGDHQPVPDHFRVDVVFANGEEAFNRFAGDLVWHDAAAEVSIVSFRICNETCKQNDGWITHDGGACPVHPDTLVDVTFHGGAYSIRPLIAGGLQWNKNKYNNCTVDRYRIVQDMTHEDGECQGVW